MSLSLPKGDIAFWMDGGGGWGEGANHLLAWSLGGTEGFHSPEPTPRVAKSADPGGGHLPPSLDGHMGEEAESREGSGKAGRGNLAPLVQNWEALLGSHCSRRTMDGSLLAPRMNSSKDSLPAGRGGAVLGGEGNSS